MTSRSWWGWGTDEAAVAGAELTALIERVAALLPDADLTDHPPLAPDDLELPQPRIVAPDALASIASSTTAERAAHARGKAFRDVVRNLSGVIEYPPDLVVRPRTEQDVIDVLDWCTNDRVAVVPYGGGSSVVGGVEPRVDGPSVSLDLVALDAVTDIDPVSRAAHIQAGALGPHLEAQLKPHGFTLRHFPQSFEFSSLGGWLATRAGGHFATLYTHIDDLVESLRVVTPSGVSESRRLPASGAGPSPDRLFLGSEGTLGVITSAWLRVQPRPLWRAQAAVEFASYSDAVAATRAIAQSGLYPANCRLLDAAEAFLNAGVSVSGGLLVLAFESADHPVGGSLARAAVICGDHGGGPPQGVRESGPGTSRPASGGAAEDWRSAFLRMPYQRDALARRSMIVETFETACTWNRFDALHSSVTDAATDAVARVAGGGLITCRFTHVYPDGPAPYFGIYAPGRWGSTVAQWDEIKAAVSASIIDAGGTITHHHAVGRDHRPWYDRQRPDPFAAALRAAKQALDPAGVLNPGVLIDP